MAIGKKIQGKKCLNRDKYILEICKQRRVLHIGCTDSPFFEKHYNKGDLLHQKLAVSTSELIGIDMVQEDIKILQNSGYDVRLIDAQNMTTLQQENLFEVILLADIIEHVPNPGLILAEAKKLLTPNGLILISVPNTFGIIRFLKSFFRYEQVHPDHVAYYSSGTLETLAQRYNLIVQELNWYQFEAKDTRLIVRLSMLLERFCTSLFPWHGEGCLVVLRISQGDL